MPHQCTLSCLRPAVSLTPLLSSAPAVPQHLRAPARCASQTYVICMHPSCTHASCGPATQQQHVAAPMRRHWPQCWQPNSHLQLPPATPAATFPDLQHRPSPSSTPAANPPASQVHGGWHLPFATERYFMGMQRQHNGLCCIECMPSVVCMPTAKLRGEHFHPLFTVHMHGPYKPTLVPYELPTLAFHHGAEL